MSAVVLLWREYAIDEWILNFIFYDLQTMHILLLYIFYLKHLLEWACQMRFNNPIKIRVMFVFPFTKIVEPKCKNNNKTPKCMNGKHFKANTSYSRALHFVKFEYYFYHTMNCFFSFVSNSLSIFASSICNNFFYFLFLFYLFRIKNKNIDDCLCFLYWSKKIKICILTWDHLFTKYHYLNKNIKKSEQVIGWTDRWNDQLNGIIQKKRELDFSHILSG